MSRLLPLTTYRKNLKIKQMTRPNKYFFGLLMLHFNFPIVQAKLLSFQMPSSANKFPVFHCHLYAGFLTL